MPQHWPAAINQSVLCSPSCPFCLGVCLFCCFFIQAAQRHTNSHSLSQPPRFSISQREEPRAVLFIVFRPMWVPSFIPRIKLSMERSFSTPNNQPSPYPTSFCLFSSREAIVLSEGNLWVVVCICHSGKEPSVTCISFGIRFLYLGASSKVLVHSSISVSLHFMLFFIPFFFPSLSLSDSFCLPWAGNECRAGRGCWCDSSQGRRHRILQSITF